MKSRKSGAQETLQPPEHPSINAVTTTQVRNALLRRCLRLGGPHGPVGNTDEAQPGFADPALGVECDHGGYPNEGEVPMAAGHFLEGPPGPDRTFGHPHLREEFVVVHGVDVTGAGWDR